MPKFDISPPYQIEREGKTYNPAFYNAKPFYGKKIPFYPVKSKEAIEAAYRGNSDLSMVFGRSKNRYGMFRKKSKHPNDFLIGLPEHISKGFEKHPARPSSADKIFGSNIYHPVKSNAAINAAKGYYGAKRHRKFSRKY